MTEFHHDATGEQLADAFGRRAAALTLPAPDLHHVRMLARQRPRSTGWRSPQVVRGVAAAAVAVVLAGGAYLVLDGNPAPSAPGTSTVDLAGGAPVVLRRIADVAATAPVTAPRPDQFVYTKLVAEGVLKGSSGPAQRSSSEVWAAQDGRTDSLAIYGDGTRVPISPTIEGDPGTVSEMPTYADLAALPTDPAELRAYLTKQFGNPFSGAELLLQGNLVPPALASAIYRVLADEPGLTVDPDAADAADRPGVGIVAAAKAGGRDELIFDKERLQLLGTRQLDATGQVVAAAAFVEQAVVDEAGQRPG